MHLLGRAWAYGKACMVKERRRGERARCVRAPAGEKEEDAHLLSAANFSVARNNTTLSLGHACSLQLVLTPTPRWPDLMVRPLLCMGTRAWGPARLY